MRPSLPTGTAPEHQPRKTYDGCEFWGHTPGRPFDGVVMAAVFVVGMEDNIKAVRTIECGVCALLILYAEQGLHPVYVHVMVMGIASPKALDLKDHIIRVTVVLSVGRLPS